MTISPEERARFERQVESLQTIEETKSISVAQARAYLDRSADPEDPPELEFYKRARTLGMARRSR